MHIIEHLHELTSIIKHIHELIHGNILSFRFLLEMLLQDANEITHFHWLSVPKIEDPELSFLPLLPITACARKSCI